MKLHSHKADRRGNTEVKLYGTWTDHMRRPAQVSVTWGPLEHPTNEPQLIAEGDVKQTTDVLFCIADMAWGMGWRPRGLPGTMAAMVQQYKIPEA